LFLLQVTSDSWTLLQRWYGGGPAIAPTAVMGGLAPNSKRPRVMLYPRRLEVCWGGKPNEVKTILAEKHVSHRAGQQQQQQRLAAVASAASHWRQRLVEADCSISMLAANPAAGVLQQCC
jgi:hypothetical protein